MISVLEQERDDLRDALRTAENKLEAECREHKLTHDRLFAVRAKLKALEPKVESPVYICEVCGEVETKGRDGFRVCSLCHVQLGLIIKEGIKRDD